LAPKPFVFGTSWKARRFPNRTRSPDLTDHVFFFWSLARSQFHINALTLSDSIFPFSLLPFVSYFTLIGYFTLTNAAWSRFQKGLGKNDYFIEYTACLQFSDNTVADVAIQTTPLPGLTVAKF